MSELKKMKGGDMKRGKMMAVVLLVVLLGVGVDTTSGFAGQADPQQGYVSTLDQLILHPNRGLCNAVATLGALILASGNTVPAFVPAEIANTCSGLGVILPAEIVEGDVVGCDPAQELCF